MQAAHEKLLVKALLQRKLSHAFSKEELERLKQKGVYKEAEHEKLEAERLLVTRQVRDECLIWRYDVVVVTVKSDDQPSLSNMSVRYLSIRCCLVLGIQRV